MRPNPNVRSENDLVTYAIAAAKRSARPPIPLTDTESAVLLGLTRQAVDQALQRAMGKLRRCLRRAGFEAPTAEPVNFKSGRADTHVMQRRAFAA